MILPSPIAITGCEVFSAYGIGMHALWQGFLSGRTSLKQTNKILPYTDFVGATDFGSFTLKDILQLLVEKALKDAGFQSLEKISKRTLLIIITRTGKISNSLSELDWLSQKEKSFENANMHFEDVSIVFISAACASVSFAIYEACTMLQAHIFDQAIICGGDYIHVQEYLGLKATRVLSKTQAKPFDKARDGISLGEGGGAIVLQRIEEVKKSPLAFIRGVSKIVTGINSASVDSDAVLDSMRFAVHEKCRLSFIHAHATGTIEGDIAEARAIENFLKNKEMKVTSHKGGTGHLLYNSGFMSIALSLLSLETQIIPPTIGLNEIDEQIKIQVLKEAYETECRDILINAAGFCGNYSSLWLSKCNI